MNDILNDYDTMQYDIMVLQETYMALFMQNKQFPNQNCISSYITHGVMILVKKHIPILEHIRIKENIVEVVLAILFFHETNNIESVCYSPCNILQHSRCYFQCIGPFPSEWTHCSCMRLQY